MEVAVCESCVRGLHGSCGVQDRSAPKGSCNVLQSVEFELQVWCRDVWDLQYIRKSQIVGVASWGSCPAWKYL